MYSYACPLLPFYFPFYLYRSCTKNIKFQQYFQDKVKLKIKGERGDWLLLEMEPSRLLACPSKYIGTTLYVTSAFQVQLDCIVR